MNAIESSTMETNETSGGLSRTVDDARSGLHNAIDKASDAARPAVDRFAEGAHEITNTLAGAATQAAQMLRERGEQLKHAPTRLTETCRGQVRASPLTALGIALVAGIAVSWAVLR